MIKLVKRKIHKLKSRILKITGYHLFNPVQMKSLSNFSFYILRYVENKNTNNIIDSIVFSKDRAMQLHAFLTSYIEQVSNRGKMFIIYTYSNERHQRSYDELMKIFIRENFIFIKEINFREQLINILEKSKAGKIIFYVDDMIFSHPIDYNTLKTVDATHNILALSRGKDMKYSIVLQKELVQPTFNKLNNNLLQFKWNSLEGESDWTYPLGVSGYMYGRIEITSMFKAINFKAPNSLEAGMQLFLPYFKDRFGLCFEFAPCVCIHANLVQTECKNPVIGTFSIDELLILWENGKRINLKEFYHKPMKISQVQEYSFL